MEKLSQITTGKAKSLFATSNPEHLIMEFRDDTSAFDGKKMEALDNKGKVNNQFNAFVMEFLASKGIEIDGRPNTKITPESYKILKQEFSADVEQHKRSEEIAQARREEKEAIKIAAVKNSADKEVIKAWRAY